MPKIDTPISISIDGTENVSMVDAMAIQPPPARHFLRRGFLEILFSKMRHAPIWLSYLLCYASPPTIFDPMQAGGFSLGHNGAKSALYGGGS